MQGFERLGNQDDPAAPVQKQEWAMQVMVDQPEDFAPARVDAAGSPRLVLRLRFIFWTISVVAHHWLGVPQLAAP